MKSGVKKYNTAYKKRVLERDTYLPLLSPKGSPVAADSGEALRSYDLQADRFLVVIESIDRER